MDAASIRQKASTLRKEHKRVQRIIDDLQEELAIIEPKLKKAELDQKRLLLLHKELVAIKRRSKELLQNGWDEK